MLRGELDFESADELAAAVCQELADLRPVIIELVGLDFTDVEGVRTIAKLAAAGERCRGRARVEVHGARGQPAELIRRLGYQTLLAGRWDEALDPIAVRRDREDR